MAEKMAEPLPLDEIKTEYGTVHELAIRGDVPERYIFKDLDAGVLDPSSCPLLDIPIIDLGLLTSSSARKELVKLRSALSMYGCFQAINHGMTASFLDEVREIGRKFFALPTEEKNKYSREAGSWDGYGNDSILFEHQKCDWMDRLYLCLRPEDKQQLKFWPKNPADFREIFNEYTMKLESLTGFLLKAMAKSVDLEENCFLNQIGQRTLLEGRFNLYPQCPRPDLVLGTKPHADGSAFTFLLQDKEVEGLQFLINDQWFRAPIIPHALLINIGDILEILSNGIFKSPIHRVVTNQARERITLAVFFAPNEHQEIEPVKELVNETRPRLYKKIKDYRSIFFHYYEQGRRPIESARI